MVSAADTHRAVGPEPGPAYAEEGRRYAALLACIRAGQVGPEQLRRHLEDPAFAAYWRAAAGTR